MKALHGEEHLADLEELRAAARERPDVLLLERVLDRRERDALMATYVSLHRAEGFGLTMAEAMALGKPVIATGYSGNLEYMTEENSYLVGWRLVPVGPGAPPYPPDHHWADPDVEEAAHWMRHVYEHPEEARQRGERARRDILERHSPAARVHFLSERLARAVAILLDRDQDSAAGAVVDRRSVGGGFGPSAAGIGVRQGRLWSVGRGWLRRILHRCYRSAAGELGPSPGRRASG